MIKAYELAEEECCHADVECHVRWHGPDGLEETPVALVGTCTTCGKEFDVPYVEKV
jgi:hypothetical protein